MTSTNPEVLLFMPLSSPGLRLQAHPATPCPWIDSITARAHWLRAGVLLFDYIFSGDIARLCVPPPQPACHTDRLWQHTCCEAFLALDGDDAYHEFNFAPSAAWAVYRFSAYRRDMSVPLICQPPLVTVHVDTEQLELRAVVDLDGLIELPAGAELRLALSAVIEDQHGNRAYWALRHPVSVPDFHHADGFVLRLPVDKC